VQDITPLLGLTKLWQLSLRSNRVRSLEGIERMTALHDLDANGNCITDFAPIHRLFKDEEEAAEWIRLAAPTQLDLSSPAGLAVHADWFNAAKWEALAVHFDAQGNPLAEHIRLCLAGGESDETWFGSHRLPTRVTSNGS
jgi:Leucine-rich repeat (LRR) protein